MQSESASWHAYITLCRLFAGVAVPSVYFFFFGAAFLASLAGAALGADLVAGAFLSAPPPFLPSNAMVGRPTNAGVVVKAEAKVAIRRAKTGNFMVVVVCVCVCVVMNQRLKVERIGQRVMV
jgi:hypothetical protein